MHAHSTRCLSTKSATLSTLLCPFSPFLLSWAGYPQFQPLTLYQCVSTAHFSANISSVHAKGQHQKIEITYVLGIQLLYDSSYSIYVHVYVWLFDWYQFSVWNWVCLPYLRVSFFKVQSLCIKMLYPRPYVSSHIHLVLALLLCNQFPCSCLFCYKSCNALCNLIRQILVCTVQILIFNPIQALFMNFSV